MCRDWKNVRQKNLQHDVLQEQQRATPKSY
jgi:hypothetical protein